MDSAATKFRKFSDTEIDHESLTAVMKEIGESEQSRNNGLKELKRMLEDVDDLDAYLNDNFLLRFLRVSKFNTKKAYERILKYYRSKKRYPVFEVCYPSFTFLVQQFRHISVLPYRAPDNSIVVIHKASAIDCSVCTFEEEFLYDVLFMEHLLENSVAQMCGVTTIMDFNGLSLEQIMKLTPQRLRMFMDFFQNSFPFRIKHVHIVNAPALYAFLYSLLYPLLSNKIRNRVVFHPFREEWRSLHTYLSPAILPEEYGGQLTSTELVTICDAINDNEEYFRKQLNFGFRNGKRRR